MKLPLVRARCVSRHLALFALSLTIAASSFATPLLAETSLTLTGEPGSGIGAGTTYSYSDGNGSFNASRNFQDGVSLGYSGPSAYWYLDFAGQNNTPLAVGLYENAAEFPVFSSDAPGMRVYGSGGSCSGSTAAFRVKQVSYGAGGEVVSFWVVFEQRCTGASGSLFGEYRFNADVSLAVSAPLSRTLQRLDSLSFQVSATGIASGPIEIQALGLPSGAQFMWDENRGGTFHWTPAASQVGRHRITFVAEDGEGRIDSVTTVIRVTGLTSLTLDSAPGDYVGQGQHYSYADTGGFAAGVNSGNGVTFTFRDNSYYNDWTIEFAAPNGEQLTPGTYVNAVAYGNQAPGRPGLRAYVAGRYCNTITGDFLIKQVTYAPGGGIESFWARFEQHCNGEAPALTGEARFNAQVTVELQAPTSRTVERGNLLEFEVTGTNVEPGPVLLTATGLPDGATFGYNGDRNGTFAWTPTVDQMGSYLVTFHARNEQGDEDSVQTRIRVTGVTSLVIVSESNEPLGNGQTYEYTPETATFTALRSNGGVNLGIEPTNFSGRWGIVITPPVGGLLVPGVYVDAQKYPTSTQPGLNVFRYFNECNSIYGNFQVKQLVVGPDSTIESFWATFEQHCNGSPRALRGEIRYNADVRVVVSAPVTRSVVRQETLEFDVSATDLEPGPIALYATHLPDGATFTDHGDRTGTFRFTPTVAQTGSHVVVFHGRNGAGREDSTATNVMVTGLTSLAIESEPGDPIGRGGSFFYPSTGGTFALGFSTYDRSITATFQEGLFGEQWSMVFAPPQGSDLYNAIFENVRRYPDATHPGFSVGRSTYPYGSCSEFEGQFQILQLERGIETQVLTLWATFDVRCVESGGWIHGEIRYNADVRLVLVAPPRFEAQRGQPIAFGVHGTDLGEGPIALSSFSEPDGATFVDQGDDTGILTWTPGWDQFGEHVVGFLADDGNGGLATARTRIVVRGVSSLAMHSDPGDSVGRGQDYAYDEDNALFWSWRSSRNHSVVTVDGEADVPWLLGFAASDTGRLEVGTYPRAALNPTPRRPSLIVTPQGYYGYPGDLYPPCSALTGEFRIKQVEYNSEGRLRSLWALFDQHCDDALPGLSGELRFNADVVVAITSPRRVEVDPDTQLQFAVQAENLAGGTASLTADGVPTGATFVDHGNNSGTFTWTPGANDLGLRTLRFVAHGPFGRTDTSVTDLRVRGTTRISLQSESGDPVGEGLQYELTRDAGTYQATRNAANGVTVRFRSAVPGDDFLFDFAAPGNAPLTTRTYSPVTRYPFQERTRAGMDVNLDGRSCGTLIGNFTVHEITYGTGDEVSSFHVSFVQRCNGAGPGLAGEILFNAGQPTFTYASFVSADLTPRLARITWRVEDHQAQVSIERQLGDTPWLEVARNVTPDGSGLVVYEDLDVKPGDRIGYRIGIEIDGVTRHFGVQWVDIPGAATLALGRAYPNPTTDAVTVSLALPDRSPARLELVDIAGRRLASVDAGALGPGPHQVTLDQVRHLPPGVYTVRLIQGGRSLITPVCVVR